VKTKRKILSGFTAVLCRAAIFILSMASCRQKAGPSSQAQTNSHKLEVISAEHFNLEKTDSCTILRIKDPWQGAEKVEHDYYLVQSGSRPLRVSDNSKVITIPVRRLICTSTTHVAMICALGEEKAIAGISGTKYIYNRKLTDRIREGLIPDVGYDASINNELIMNIAPDLMIMYGVGAEGEGYTGKLREAGIKVMTDADYLENDPIGKAEWIKVFGALFCRERMADSIFSAISESYTSLKEYILGNIQTKPLVMLGLPFRDTWYVSPGNSYISKLIDDAGGTYIWRDKQSPVSLPCSLEEVYLKSLKADFWLNIGTVTGKKEITGFDPRLSGLQPFMTGKLYNNNRRVADAGGNDYWESGTVNPDIILKDIATILHPDLFPDYIPCYYLKIE
jgi:iron complex transport system substrate-binding protein